MPNLIDLAGQRFGKLVVVDRAPNGRGRKSRWRCQCDCGNVVTVQGGNMVGGRQVSCGCHGQSGLNVTHGQNRVGKRTPTYSTWSAMIARCTNQRNRAYRYYGARGVTVCERWRDSFEAFVEDMGERPAGTSIDRIDADGNYEPGNCRWVIAKAQASNRRYCMKPSDVAQATRMFEQGATKKAIAAELGFAPSTVAAALRRSTS